MAGKQLNTKILAVRIIPNADPMLLKNLDVRPGDKSLGIFTTDCDDVSYTAVDEATKKADVHVAYAKSMYAGSGNASTALAGEFIGILSGPDPEEVRSGLQAAFSLIENDAHFYEANETGTVVYFAHCISRTGSYLSSQAGVPEGTPMAYLIAPPLEAMYGVDAALKAADVKMCVLYAPPSETNFGGALLTGSQSACKAACDAFAAAVEFVADNPIA